MTHDEMIEAVARALCCARARCEGCKGSGEGGCFDLDLWDQEAKAAIAAMQPHIAAEREDAARRALEWMRPQVEELLFRQYWKQDGMNTEQAHIHAKARTDEGLAAAPIAQFREAGNG